VAALQVRLAHPLRAFDLAVDLEVGRSASVLVGPSGAGKTTILRAIAGLLRPESGRVALGERVWLDTEHGVNVPPEERSVGLVFQEYALFPHLSVRRNVAYGAREDVDELLERFRLASLADARPGELSGGERQRVGLARALARRPAVLLLDEPLSALDAQTRAHVREELRVLLDELDIPTLVVTHDFADAAALARRVSVLVDGQVLQTGAPEDLIAAPANPFVADFAGGNLLVGTARPASDGLTEVELAGGLRVRSTDPARGRVGVLVYPWEIAVAFEEPQDSTQNHLRGEVASLVPVANRMRVRIGPLTAEITASSAERLGLRRGLRVVASFKAAGTRLLPLD
jgi:molybdate transport system ATP-binding protein